ncbi:diaminopimelate epimerase [Rhodanobacter sp. L36]|uniref:diaminopimelate epimerase n=1 Tax=Rhodanobacter sp. L36 TaxID=1747221 RepID=UPI00131C28A1|nr:diaminopimelate epimerase [Rhodanobacter sp. L36]
MRLTFSKMHGIGNDFVVLDCRNDAFALDETQIRALADRHTGVGFDQLLSVEPARDRSCAFYYGIWNADGSPSGQCGNGVRCVAAWLHRAGALAIGEDVRLESPSGPVTVRLLSANEVTVDMGEPDFEPVASGMAFVPAADRYIFTMTPGSPPGPLAGSAPEAGVVSMGNPHAVVLIDDLADPSLAVFGPAMSTHEHFAHGANIGFVRQRDRAHLQLRVHERGAGWTQACGTGACAAMAVLHRRGDVDNRVHVQLPGGTLRIDWAGPGHTLWMTGPAAFAFEGTWPVPASSDETAG